MGYRISWIARSGKSTAELLQVSQRDLTGERHEFPDVGWFLLDLPIPCAWVLLIADGSENFAELTSSHAQTLSEGGNETLFFWCSDTSMATELASFKNGEPAWSIQFDFEDNSKRPAMNGGVPPIAHEILARLQAKQQADDDADYIYGLTAEVGRLLVGFRHDVDLKLVDLAPFQVLRATFNPSSKRQHAWWQVWKR